MGKGESLEWVGQGRRRVVATSLFLFIPCLRQVEASSDISGAAEYIITRHGPMKGVVSSCTTDNTHSMD